MIRFIVIQILIGLQYTISLVFNVIFTLSRKIYL